MGDYDDLRSVEKIKVLRARFARAMDTKNWSVLRDCITKDCFFDCTEEAGVDEPWMGSEAIVGNIRRSFATAQTVHHAHTPEIEILDADNARGIWAMQDMLRFPGVPIVELTGYGHYHEEYRRGEDGRWRIGRYRLMRLRSDVARTMPPGMAWQAPSILATDPSRSIRAALIDGYGPPDAFRVGELPEPKPGPGQVLIRVAGAAVNPIDLKLRAGVFELFMPLTFPAQLGGDVSGIIEVIGENVRDFKPGDRVMGMVNPMANGAYAEKMVADASVLAKVPEDIDIVKAAAIPMAALTGSQLIELGLKPNTGDRVLVTGAAGAVGRAAVYAAVAAGAKVVAGVRRGREQDVSDSPVVGVVDINDPAAVTAAGPFNGIADTVGGLVVERLAATLGKGRVIASVVPPSPVPDAEHGISVVPVWVSFDRARLERFARDMVAGSISVPVARTLDLGAVAEAHRLVGAPGLNGKVILQPSG